MLLPSRVSNQAVVEFCYAFDSFYPFGISMPFSGIPVPL